MKGIICFVILTANRVYGTSHNIFARSNAKVPKFGVCHEDDDCEKGLLCLDAITGFTCRDPKEKAKVGNLCGVFTSGNLSITLRCENDMYCEGRCTNYGNFGDSCDEKYLKCINGLTCEDKKCTVTYDSDLAGLGKNFTDDYTKTFLDRIERNVSEGIFAVGGPILDGHSAPDAIPDDDDGKQAGISAELKTEYGDYCISKFPGIVKDTIVAILGHFYSEENFVGVSEAQLNTKKKELTTMLQVEVQRKLDDFVESEWSKFKEEAAEDVEMQEA